MSARTEEWLNGMPGMKEHNRLNYLHYGDALPLLRRHVLEDGYEELLKSEFLAQAFGGSADNAFLKSVILSYGRLRSKKISTAAFAQDVRSSFSAQALFRTLGCRGFSHAFVSQITGFPYHLRRRVDIRVAITSRHDLFYPPRVRRYLQRHVVNHCFVDNSPAIAFALGRIIGRNWYITILQSDIAYSRSAHVRDHFRGWRKVLFAAILRSAVGAADSVYLCPSAAVMKGTFVPGMKPDRTPDSWKQIYDRTARDFHMTPVTLPRAVDIQIYSRQKPVYCRDFHALKIDDLAIETLRTMYAGL